MTSIPGDKREREREREKERGVCEEEGVGNIEKKPNENEKRDGERLITIRGFRLID